MTQTLAEFKLYASRLEPKALIQQHELLCNFLHYYAQEEGVIPGFFDEQGDSIKDRALEVYIWVTGYSYRLITK